MTKFCGKEQRHSVGHRKEGEEIDNGQGRFTPKSWLFGGVFFSALCLIVAVRSFLSERP